MAKDQSLLIRSDEREKHGIFAQPSCDGVRRRRQRLIPQQFRQRSMFNLPAALIDILSYLEARGAADRAQGKGECGGLSGRGSLHFLVSDAVESG